MTLSSVYGTKIMDAVGAQEILVEQKVGARWIEYATYTKENYPEFYNYGKVSKVGNFSFVGVPGVTYRVVLTAYDELDGGSDTGTVTITEEVCT